MAEVSGGVSEEVRAVLDYLHEHPGARTNQMTASLSIPRRTLERLLKKLKDEQKIVFKGAPKTGGYYVRQGEDL